MFEAIRQAVYQYGLLLNEFQATGTVSCIALFILFCWIWDHRGVAFALPVGALCGFSIYAASCIPSSAVQSAISNIETLETQVPKYELLHEYKQARNALDIATIERLAPYLYNEASDKQVILLAALNNQLLSPIADISKVIEQPYVSQHQLNESLRLIRLHANELNPDALASLNAFALNDIND